MHRLACFREAATTNQHVNLTEYTESVTGYIYKCMDDVTVIKNITTRANDKPWFTREVCALLRARNAAFKFRDKEALRAARANLNRGMRTAKRAYGCISTPLCNWLLNLLIDHRQ